MGCCGQRKAITVKTREEVRAQYRPDNAGDVYCIDCGSAYKEVDVTKFKHPSEKNPCRPNAMIPLVQYVIPRNSQCARCPERRLDGRCQAGIDADPTRSWEIYRGNRLPWARCLKGHYLPIERICPECGHTTVDVHGVTSCRYCPATFPEAIPLLPPISTNKTHLPGNVITMLDNRYIRHAYVLAWSVLRLHTLRKFIVYDIGIEPGPMVDEMESWGVEFRKIEPITTHPRSWHCYQKPGCIQDSLRESDTLYMDADTICGGDLSDIFRQVQNHPFVPDHGWHASHSDIFRIPIEVQEFIGRRQRNWEGVEWPNAGVCAFTRGQKPFVDKWVDAIQRICEHPDYVNLIPYSDQTILSCLFEWPTADGMKYDYFWMENVDAIGSLWHACEAEPTIIHMTGPGKSTFSTWPSVIHWPPPFLEGEQDG